MSLGKKAVLETSSILEKVEMLQPTSTRLWFNLLYIIYTFYLKIIFLLIKQGNFTLMILQASIISRKKEAKAEELQAAKEEMSSLEKQVEQKNSQAQGLGGSEVLTEEEVGICSYFQMINLSYSHSA